MTYPANWAQIALAVKEAAGWRCMTCGHPHDPPAGYTLTTHHKDGNKANNNRSNLIADCQRCHLKKQSRLRLYGPEDDRQLRLPIVESEIATRERQRHDPRRITMSP